MEVLYVFNLITQDPVELIEVVVGVHHVFLSCHHGRKPPRQHEFANPGTATNADPGTAAQ